VLGRPRNPAARLSLTTPRGENYHGFRMELMGRELIEKHGANSAKRFGRGIRAGAGDGKVGSDGRGVRSKSLLGKETFRGVGFRFF